MGLRIQNNIAAMNTHRQLTIADAGLNKSLERLSSGFRINRAADDAAGLAISSQFRADIASSRWRAETPLKPAHCCRWLKAPWTRSPICLPG